MGPQSYESPICGNFGTPTWESRDKMPFGCGPVERRIKPREGQRGHQPDQSLEKFRKYKGGRKLDTMVALSSPKMFM
jgi:hypothetical protein